MNTGKFQENSDSSPCGPGCHCAPAGLGTRGKMVVCLLVAIAAAVVLTRSYLRKAGNESAQGGPTYAATLPVTGGPMNVECRESSPQEQKTPAATATLPEPAITAPTDEKPEKAEADLSASSRWGTPLKSLASLNEVAAEQDAVFVYLPAKGQRLDESAGKKIEAAADKARSMKVGIYSLAEESEDYRSVKSQVPVPCVLALVKGRGMSVVSRDITEGNLLQALIAASRPSGCCPPGTSDCQPGDH